MTDSRTLMPRALKPLLLVALLGLSACVAVPAGPGGPGPSVRVMPGAGKSFDQFRFDDGACRQFAYEQVGGVTPGQAAEQSAVGSAVVGTVLGAAVGAAVGGSSGAAVGAGTGLLVGGAAGVGAADASAYHVQRRYDIAYGQCMYSKGHRVPGAGARRSAPPAPPGYYYGPPPPPPSR